MRRNPPRRPWLRPLLLLVLLLELVGASAVVRSDLFAREPVSDALARLAQRLGGHFTIGGLAPSGLTGVELTDVAFHPDDHTLPGFRAERLVVTPRLDRLLVGQLAVREVVVDGLAVRLDVDGLTSLVERFATPEVTRRSSGGEAAPAWLPDELRVHSGRIELRDPRLAGGELAVGLHDLRLASATSSGEPSWRVEGGVGLGIGRDGHLEVALSAVHVRARLTLAEPSDWLGLLAPLPGLPPELRVVARAVTVTWPGELSLERVSITGLGAPIPALDQWHLDGLDARELCLERDPVAGPSLTVREGGIWLEGPRGSARLALDQAEAWRAGEGRPAGALVRLGEPGRGTVDVSVTPASEGPGAAWQIAADAHHYPLDDWAELFDGDAPIRLGSGYFTGAVTITLADAQAPFDVVVDGTLEEGRARAPFLSARPLEDVTVGVSGQIAVDPGRRRLEWRDGRLLLAGVPVVFEAELAWSERAPRLSMTAHLEDVDANELRRGLPRGLAPALEHVDVGGTVSATVSADLDAAHPEDAALELELDTSRLEVLDFGPDVPLARLDGDAFALAIPTSDGVGRNIGPATDTWVAYDDVSALLVPALVSAEDGRFFSHDGFDWRAIEASVELNLRARRIVRGGSTISQQVVRSLFLGSERTLGRKFEEAFLTWQLEQLVPKRRIMELYVNAVHWGPGTYGITEAAATYFRRRPEDLTVSEVAFLASILPAPDYFGTQYARGILTASRREKVCNIVRNMRNAGTISSRQASHTCRDAQDGLVSIVPPPEWLVDPAPTHPDAEPAVADAADEVTLASSW